jgi:hypothetical protein
MVLLEAGPANGRHVPTPEDDWVWVDIDHGEILVFDPALPETQQHPERRVRGGWEEYIRNPRDRNTYQWSRRTPLLPHTH